MRLTMQLCIIMSICFLVSGIHSYTANANSLLNLSTSSDFHTFNSDVYDFIARIAVKGKIRDFPKNIQPYSCGEVANILSELSEKLDKGEISLSDIEKERLAKITILLYDAIDSRPMNKAENFKLHPFIMKDDEYQIFVDIGASGKMMSRNGRIFPSDGQVGIISLRPTFSGQIENSFAFISDIKWDYHIGNVFYDLLSEEKMVSYEKIGAENIISTQAYGVFKLPWFKLLLGRDDLRWGPGYHGQLMISNNPQPMNMIKLDARYKNFKYNSLTAKLSSVIGKKYMSAHRIESVFFNRLNIGLCETLIFGEQFEINYLNPLQLYIIAQDMSESDSGKANLLESVDFSYRVIDGFQIYGELAVDEARLFVKPLNHWDTMFGILGGFYIADPFSINDTDFRMEYAFTNQYFYTYHQPLANYKHIESSIGHWMGTDADDLWCELKHRFTERLEAALSYELERHGEGNIDKPHPVGRGIGDGKWTFLSGINENRHSFGIGVSYRRIGKYLLGVECTRSYMKNIDNKQGENGTGNQLSIEIAYWF